MRQLEVVPLPMVTTPQYTEVAADVSSPTFGKQKLWYRVFDHQESIRTGDAGFLAIGLIFPAMELGIPLRVHGSVCPILLRNLERFQEIWNCWFPERYSVVPIIPDDELPAEKSDDGTSLVCFSGGVDASYSLYRHVKKLAGRQTRRIGGAVLIHGFDVPIENEDEFSAVYASVRNMPADLGVPLMRMSTNIRRFDGEWEHLFSAAAASCLHLLGGRHESGIIASGPTWRQFRPTRVHAVTDPLLTAARFETVHDGAAAGRQQKITTIAEWPVALQHLRVCWEGTDRSTNCCVCEKCIRTILSFRCLALRRPPCFSRDVTDEQIRQVRIKNLVQLLEFESILDAAERAGMASEHWVKALRKRVTQQYRHIGKASRFSRLRSTIALRTRLRRLWQHRLQST